ncbi:tRNA(Ile)-lysidine synthase TilS/MesJ [Ruminococcaceae bacterium KH2T8]|nr:tRNA(Ile)-lysidine synthase TilS/MesJ [Ruminococcaceae bacterium KH2T8]
MSDKKQQAEEIIRGEFHKELFAPFTKACRDYSLIEEGDRIAVCISGGKDSMLMAKLFQEIIKHDKVQFELVFLVMDPGYAKENRELIESNASSLGIPVTIFESDVFEAAYSSAKGVCYKCARMRRGYLYSKAKELGCNKIALGHHYDDVIETILMGMLFGGQIQSMRPKLRSRNYEGMELIRPMYLIREADICSWRDSLGLRFLDCACKVTARGDEASSKRSEIKALIASLKKDNPAVEANIFRSVENVDLDTVLEYKKDGKRHSFLEDY